MVLEEAFPYYSLLQKEDDSFSIQLGNFIVSEILASFGLSTVYCSIGSLIQINLY